MSLSADSGPSPGNASRMDCGRVAVKILSAAGLAPKTIVNLVTVVKFVVASAVEEEGDQLHPRVWSRSGSRDGPANR